MQARYNFDLLTSSLICPNPRAFAIDNYGFIFFENVSFRLKKHLRGERNAGNKSNILRS